MSDLDELRREFEESPAWPDPLPLGLIIIRTMTRPLDSDAGDAGETEVTWSLSDATTDGEPRHALLGELVVKHNFALATTTVVMPLLLREAEASGDPEIAKTHAAWASSIMYDHAAMALRSALAGSGVQLHVPFNTPEVKVNPHRGR